MRRVSQLRSDGSLEFGEKFISEQITFIQVIVISRFNYSIFNSHGGIKLIK